MGCPIWSSLSTDTVQSLIEMSTSLVYSLLNLLALTVMVSDNCQLHISDHLGAEPLGVPGEGYHGYLH